MTNLTNSAAIAACVVTEANAILLLGRARSLFDDLQPMADGPARERLEVDFWRHLNEAWTVIQRLENAQVRH
ncbi:MULTISPECIES: hypothetical protein [Sphingobium]|jgi:hypothetical protein|nr:MULTISPECIES: hypothetical protein [Sphingobium]EQB10869.1 hypothetical protein RLDS_25875 [Sphingobium lactosutens DS20]QNG44000.1 hypothetical protein H3V42_19105 [Sphingobium yanoikuyae]